MIAFKKVRSEEDIAVVVRLAREIWTEHYTPIIGRDQVEYMLDTVQSHSAVAGQIKEGCRYSLVLGEDGPVGYVAVAPQADPSVMLLSKIYIRKGQRGVGFGKAALSHAVKLAREAGAGVLNLTVNRNNVASVAWYEHMGFRKTGSVVKDIGNGFVMDDFLMEMPV